MAEIVGITASIVILLCFLMNNERDIRIGDAIGAFLYVIYGFMIGSFSNIFLNSALICIQIYKLVTMKRRKNGKRTES